MAVKTFVAQVTVVVENEAGPVKLFKNRLVDALTDCVYLDFDIESGAASVDKDEKNKIVAVEINWKTLKEKK
jgi:hypothetical protein